MDIVVLAKFVPDVNRVPPDAWDRERGTLIRSRLEMEFNPLDRVALRAALAIRARRAGDRVVVLSMGPSGAAAMLKEAIAYGADGAVLLTDSRFAGADTLATAYTLSRAIRAMVARSVIGPDYAVLCGMQSPDGDTAQVPAQVACFLDAPLYPYVSDFRDGEGGIEFTCLHSVGFQRVVTGRRPFVATTTRLLPDLPFHVTLAAMRRANETLVITWGSDDLDLDPRRIGLDGSKTRVVRIFEPPRKHQVTEMLSAEAEDFAQRAARLLRQLKASLAGGGLGSGEPTGAGVQPSAEQGTGYYAGDCLALCELADGALAPVSVEVLSACARIARNLGCAAVAVVPGACGPSMAEALRLHGASKVYAVEGIERSVFRVRERALAVAELVRRLRPQVVLAPATLTGRVVAPYLSALLDCGLTADCSGLDIADFTRGNRTFGRILYQTRPALGGNVMATIVSVYDDPNSGRPQMATVRPGALPAETRPAPSCALTVFRPSQRDEEFGDRVMLERRGAEDVHIDLSGFEVIVCVGMGVGDRETIERLVEPFREALERFFGLPVGLGCSRAMVDAGVLGHSHQIGQTGVVVKPKLYVGVGVSGAVQHKIGMEGSRVIVCINRDSTAPMRSAADHMIVGDVRLVLPTLTDLATAGSAQ